MHLTLRAVVNLARRTSQLSGYLLIDFYQQHVRFDFPEETIPLYSYISGNMKSVLLLLFLPCFAFAQREGAFKEDLLYVYLGFITICLLLAYGGKMIKWVSRKFIHSHE